MYLLGIYPWPILYLQGSGYLFLAYEVNLIQHTHFNMLEKYYYISKENTYACQFYCWYIVRSYVVNMYFDTTIMCS